MANRKTSPQKGSQSVNWSRTRYTGVRYWESETRKHRGRPDKCYVIRYKNQGRSFSETIGWQSEGITQEYCSTLRGQITSNIKTGQSFHSLQEKRNLENHEPRQNENTYNQEHNAEKRKFGKPHREKDKSGKPRAKTIIKQLGLCV